MLLCDLYHFLALKGNNGIESALPLIYEQDTKSECK